MVIVLLILWSTHRGRWSHNNPIICHTAEGIHLQRTDAQHTPHAEAWRRTGNESINYMCNVCVLCVCVLRVSSIIFFLYFSLGCVVCVETCVCMMFHFFRYFIFFSSPHTFVRAPFMQAIPIDAYTCEAEKKKLYGIIKTNRNDVWTFFFLSLHPSEWIFRRHTTKRQNDDIVRHNLYMKCVKAHSNALYLLGLLLFRHNIFTWMQHH